MNLDTKLEAILFLKGEPVALTQLAKFCELSVAEVGEGLEALETRLAGGATGLVRTGSEVALVTRPEVYEFLKVVSRAENEEELSKAALETLAIIIYEAPVSAAKVDYVRGVNSRYSIRSLLVRGLIERTADVNDSRVFHYSPSSDLMRHMGVAKITDFPDYSQIKEKLRGVLESSAQQN